MQDPILQWMEATRTGVWMAVENSIKLVTLAVVGWFFYLVVVVPVRAELAHWMAVWRRWQRISRWKKGVISGEYDSGFCEGRSRASRTGD